MSDAHTRLEPVDRWDEADQGWVTVWVTVPCQEAAKQTHCPRCGHAEASESPKLCWWCARLNGPRNDSALTSMLGPVL